MSSTMEQDVERILSEVLGRTVTRAKDGDRPLRDLGLGSLRMIRLLGDLEAHFSIRIGDDQVVEENFGSLDRLVRFVEHIAESRS